MAELSVTDKLYDEVLMRIMERTYEEKMGYYPGLEDLRLEMQEYCGRELYKERVASSLARLHKKGLLERFELTNSEEKYGYCLFIDIVDETADEVFI